jgi:arginase family enzyme
VRKTFAEAHPAEAVAADPGKVAAGVRRRVAKAKRVWIDLDADALDPAFAPAVPEPMPFGLTPMQLLALFDAAWSSKVVGVSVSEFDPGRDDRDRTLSLLGWLVERVLLKKYQG